MKIILNQVDDTCKNCGNFIDKDYCPYCGQAKNVERVTLISIWNDFSENFLGVNSGFLYTIKHLFTAPGNTVRLYLEGHRKLLMKPVQLYLLILTLYFIINNWLGIGFTEFHENIRPTVAPNEKVSQIMGIINEIVQTNFKFILALSIPFMALSLKLLYRKSGYNYFEFLVFSLFTGSILYIISELLSVVYLTTNSLPLYSFCTCLSGALFIVYAITQFFQRKGFKDYLKAFLSYLLSQIFFIIFLGILITIGVAYLVLTSKN